MASANDRERDVMRTRPPTNRLKRLTSIAGAAAVLLAAGSLGPACFSLDDLATFPCASDHTCPDGFYCDATSHCASCTKNPETGSNWGNFCISTHDGTAGCSPHDSSTCAGSCEVNYSGGWVSVCATSPGSGGLGGTCAGSSCAPGFMCFSCHTEDACSSGPAAAYCLGPAASNNCYAGPNGNCNGMDQCNCYQYCDMMGTALPPCQSGTCKSILDGNPGPVIDGIYYGVCGRL